MRSDNPDGAENQQERLIRTGWVVGFVDGEGCFSIGFVKQPDRANRRGYTTGYQVFHRFVVTQGAKSTAALEELHSFFGVGRLYVKPAARQSQGRLAPVLRWSARRSVGSDHSVLPAESAPDFEAQ